MQKPVKLSGGIGMKKEIDKRGYSGKETMRGIR